MKKFFLLLVIAVVALQVSAQHQRRVMVEEFTQASCGPCAAANPSFNATLDANTDKVTPLKYQVWWPGFDPMYLHNVTDVNNRVAYYGVSGVPDGYQNGTTNFSPGSYSASSINTAYNNMTPVTIAITHSFNAAFDSVYVAVAVTSDDAISGDLRLRMAIYEKEIIFTTAPGSNGEKEFFSVMKKMLPSADGTTTGSFTAGETKTYNFAWKMRNCYNLNQVGALAWLQDDDTKEVWQSERSDPFQSVPGGNNAGVTIASSLANKLICTNTFTPLFTLKNLSATALTAATINYSLNNGPTQVYDWTGTLNPNLTTAITLPEITLANPGTNPISISVVSTNFGAQTNQVTSTGTINLIAQFVASAPPVADGFETAFPPAGWGIKNATAGGWEPAGVGGYDLSSTSAKMDFYSLAVGTNAEMYLPKINLATATGNSWLTFDHAHTYYNATNINDRLRIDVSTDCGTTWSTLWDKMGDALATTPAQTGAFVPTADQWVTDSVDLTSKNGNEVLIRFRATSDYGNNLYVDNVNVATGTSGTVTLLPLSNFKVQPNPANTNTELHFNLEVADDIQVMVFNNLGILVAQQQLGNLGAGAHSARIEAAALPTGNYRVVLQGKNGLAQLPLAIVR